MVKYECFRCGYINKIKSNFIKHLNRKFTCKPKIKDITIEEINDKYFNKEKKENIFDITRGSQKVAKSSQKVAKSSQKVAKSSPNIAQISLKITKINQNLFNCKFCNKNFKHKSSKYKHEKNSCKVKKENESYDDLKRLVELLNEKLNEKDNQLNEKDNKLKRKEKELKKKDKEISRLLKKTGVNIKQNINNIQNNIKILAYNKTDLTHLKDKDYIKFLSHSNFCVPHMIKKLHFDPKKPENHNIYISNLKNNYIMVYDDDKWNIQDRNEIIHDMIEDNTNILEDKIENWLETGKQYPQIMKKFNRYLEKREKNIVLDKIKKEIKFILYNNRKTINSEL